MLQDIDKQYFMDRHIAKTLHDIEDLLTEFEDNGGEVIIECQYANPSGISFIINNPSKPSNHIISLQELQRHTITLEHFNNLSENEKYNYQVVIIVTIDKDISLKRLIDVMTKRDNLLRIIYEQEYPVFSKGKEKQQVTFVILRNQIKSNGLIF